MALLRIKIKYVGGASDDVVNVHPAEFDRFRERLNKRLTNEGEATFQLRIRRTPQDQERGTLVVLDKVVTVEELPVHEGGPLMTQKGIVDGAFDDDPDANTLED